MKTREEKEKLMQILISIVNDEFDLDIRKKGRKRELIDARMIYAKILTEMGYGRSLIAGPISKNHATIIHYVTHIDTFLMHDAVLMEKFRRIRDSFYEFYDPIYSYGPKSLRSEILILRKQIKLLLLDQEKLRRYEEDNERFIRLFNLIRDGLPVGEEEKIEYKIKLMLNRMSSQILS